MFFLVISIICYFVLFIGIRETPSSHKEPIAPGGTGSDDWAAGRVRRTRGRWGSRQGGSGRGGGGGWGESVHQGSGKRGWFFGCDWSYCILWAPCQLQIFFRMAQKLQISNKFFKQRQRQGKGPTAPRCTPRRTLIPPHQLSLIVARTTAIVVRPLFAHAFSFWILYFLQSLKWQDSCYSGKTLSTHDFILPTLISFNDRTTAIVVRPCLNVNFSFQISYPSILPSDRTTAIVVKPCLSYSLLAHAFVCPSLSFDGSCHSGKTLATPAFFLHNLLSFHL